MTHLLPIFPDVEEPFIIAGPCSAESRQQVLDTAHALHGCGVQIFRAGLWKPRTHPGSFEGVGAEGFSWLKQVKWETGMRVAVEVATPAHVRAALEAGISIFWIGARTTGNPFAMQEMADALSVSPEVTVLVKNPLNADIELWIGALQRIYAAGVRRLGAIHRGFSQTNTLYRNAPHWDIPIELRRRYPHLPILCDPSHMAGRNDWVEPLSQQALNMGFSGLFVEVHCNPDEALSDAKQQLTPQQFKAMVNRLTFRQNQHEDEQLEQMRRLIDECDQELIDVLKRRLNIAAEIGRHKRSNKMPVVQASRYNQVLNERIEWAIRQGIDGQFMRAIMQLVHDEAVKVQLSNE